MSALEQIILAGGGSSSGKSFAYSTSAIEEVDTSTPVTFSSIAIGTAASDRRVHVAVHFRGNGNGRALDTVTIGGVTATVNVNGGSDGTRAFVAICTANVPTGTTADVVVAWTGGTSSAVAIGVWYSYGLTSSVANSTSTSTADPASATLTTLSGGFAISAAQYSDDSGNFTWTSLDKRYDGSANDIAYSGSSIGTTGATITPDVNYSGSDTNRRCVGASF